MRRHLLQIPPKLSQTALAVLELPSLCLTWGRDEEWKALPSFPPQDREKSQNIPDDWTVFESHPPTDDLGVRMGMKWEIPVVAYGTGAGSDHLFINPKDLAQTESGFLVDFPLIWVNLKLFFHISDNSTNSGQQEKNPPPYPVILVSRSTQNN